MALTGPQHRARLAWVRLQMAHVAAGWPLSQTNHRWLYARWKVARWEDLSCGQARHAARQLNAWCSAQIGNWQPRLQPTTNHRRALNKNTELDYEEVPF